MNIYVLGGGLSGNFCALQIPHSKIITIENKHIPPYLFLYDCPESRTLCNMVGIEPIRADNWRIGFSWQGNIYDECTEEMVTEYDLKTYGTKAKSNRFKQNYYTRLANSYYDVNKKLSDIVRPRIIEGTVEAVDLKEKTVTYADKTKTEFTTVDYDMLINTLPLPTLMRLSGLNIEAEFLAYNPLYISKMQDPWARSEYGTIQVIDKDSPITRYIRGTLNPEECYVESLRAIFKTSIKVEYGKIINNEEFNRYRDDYLKMFAEKYKIFPAGRAAMWKSHYDTNDMIRDTLELLKSQPVAQIVNAEPKWF